MHFFIVLLLSVLAALLATAFVVTWAKGFSFRETRHNAANRRSYTLARDLPWPQRLRLSCSLLVVQFLPPREQGLVLANFNSAEHLNGKITYTADAAFTYTGLSQRFLIAKIGTDDYHINLAGAADEPIGVCTDAPVAGEQASVDVFGAAPGTKRGIASAAIAAGADVYTAAGGLLQSEPGAAGTYWLVGRALHAAVGAGDDFEFTSVKPIKLVVIAALTSSQNATDTLLGLQASYNALQADVAAIAGALASPALVKVI